VAGAKKSPPAKTRKVSDRPRVQRVEAPGSVLSSERPRFAGVAEALATVPVASAAMGSVAGLPASRFVASHFTVATKDSQILVAGPKVVERAWGLSLTKQQLGGVEQHLRNGVVHNLAEDEADAIAQLQRFIGYLPQSVWELAPRTALPPGDSPGRMEAELSSIVPNERAAPYAMRRVIELVFDFNSVFEVRRNYGPSIITCFARLNGQSVGVFANDSEVYAGSMSVVAAKKVEKFIDLCQTFHLPIITIVDEPGFTIGPDAEAAGTILTGTSAVLAAHTCQVPWASVLIRRAFGVAAAAHFGPNSYVIAWPSAQTGALPVEGGVAVAFSREIAAAADPEKKRRELEEALEAKMSPFPRAEHLGVHELIEPQETRPMLCEWLDTVAPLLPSLCGPVAFPFRP